MMPFPKTKALLGSFFALSIAASAALAQDVSSVLTVARVIVQRDGSEALVPAPHVTPGDLLQYTSTYQNTGKRPVTQLLATVPIAAGTEFVSAASVSGQLQASLGGPVFETVPLIRRQQRPDGSVAVVPVPLSEYRALRWPQMELAPGASVSRTARVRVIAPAQFNAANAAAASADSATSTASTARR
jgi:uncharacterized repeat protein (TIGR01451 family)